MIEIKGLYKSFDDKTVLSDINADFANGKTNLIIGQSGSGKTVLMKCIVGLLTPEKGEVLYDGRNLVMMGKKEKKMLTQFSRTELLLGKEAMDKLKNSRVAVFGIGGVGGYVCEALVRSGVGAFDLIDDDKVCLTNLNRQIIATRKTVGKYKVDVMKERMLEINPDVNVRIHKCFFLPENADEFPFDEYDYVVDAVDTVTAKIELVMKSQAMNVPIISSMGAGNKLDASAFKVADIYKTQMCPLAKVMRRELKKRHVKKLKVVYSEEKPTRPIEDMAISCRNHCICPPGAEHKCTERRDIPGSVAFVPSVVGLIIAGEVVKDLCAK